MTPQEKARAKRLWIAFQLTVNEWDTIDVYQEKVCFVCRQRPPGKRLATDHSHEDGLVRGLLCQRCNALLGKLENAFKRYGLHKVPGLTVLQVLLRLGKYLMNPPAVAALGRSVYGYPGKIGTKDFRKWAKKRAGV